MIALDDDVGWGPLGSRKREHSRELVDKLQQSARVRRSLDIAGIALDDGHGSTFAAVCALVRNSSGQYQG
jgi:hypothetical protein